MGERRRRDADDPPPADPLAVTAEALPDGNRFVCSAPAFEGVRALDPDRRPRDVRGRELSVRFEVVDRRARRAGPEIHYSSPIAARPTGDAGAGRGPYRVTVSLQGVGPEQMIGGGVGSGSSSSSAGAAVVGMTGTYPRPGIYSLTLPVPRARTTATVRVEMVDEVTDRAPPPPSFFFPLDSFFPLSILFSSPLFLTSLPFSFCPSLSPSLSRFLQRTKKTVRHALLGLVRPQLPRPRAPRFEVHGGGPGAAGRSRGGRGRRRRRRERRRQEAEEAGAGAAGAAAVAPWVWGGASGRAASSAVLKKEVCPSPGLFLFVNVKRTKKKQRIENTRSRRSERTVAFHCKCHFFPPLLDVGRKRIGNFFFPLLDPCVRSCP